MPGEDWDLPMDAEEGVQDAGSGSAYRLRNVLTQSPEKLKVTILAVLGVAMGLLTDVDPSLLETVGAGIAIERLLDLFYVAPVRKAQDEAGLVALQAETLKGIDLGRQLARPRIVMQRPAEDS